MLVRMTSGKAAIETVEENLVISEASSDIAGSEETLFETVTPRDKDSTSTTPIYAGLITKENRAQVRSYRLALHNKDFPD